MYILGIETSCDDTGIAVYDSEKHCIYDAVYSQVTQHENYGGVVPEIASREHVCRIIPLLKSVLQKAGITQREIHAVAYTVGPGLMGALLVGISFAKSFAYGLNIPAIPVHHMEGHLLAPLLESPAPVFPFIALLISGGHTQLVSVKKIGEYEILGDTLDDAAGEAFDKTARVLGLGYPGGAALAKLAEKGDAKKFKFSRPMTNRPGCDFSFSGLKTQVLTTYKNIFNHINNNTNLDIKMNLQIKADIAASFQQAVIDTLVIKCKRVLAQTKLNQLVVAGGVSANISLRQSLGELLKKLNGNVYFPRPEFSTDNGAMIAFAGFCHLAESDKHLSIKAYSRGEIGKIFFDT